MNGMKWGGLLLLVLHPAIACGQYGQVWDPNQAQAKRAWREKAVARAGPAARPLVEGFGEEAVGAIFACSPATARKLAEWNAAGGLNRMPRPVQMLTAIRFHGDAVANFAMRHQDLEDVRRFDVFMSDPMTYAMSLKTLDAGVIDQERRRLQLHHQHTVDLLIAIGVLGGLFLLIWKFRDRLRGSPY
jgi:hypothetical protein